MLLVRRIHSRGALIGTGLLVLALLFAPNAQATDDAGKLAGVALISTGSIAICAPFGGGFEIGAGLGLLIFDPPDPANACNAVVLSNFQADFPPVQTLNECSNAQGPLADAMNFAMDDMDNIVTLIRAARAAQDRFEGAIQIGETACAEDRRQEYDGFRALMAQAGPRAAASLLGYVELQNELEPAILQQPISPQELKLVRDILATGGFPPVDDVALNVWDVSPEERARFQAAYAGLTDPEIDAVYAQWAPTGALVNLEFALVNLATTILEFLSLPPLPPTPPSRFNGVRVAPLGEATLSTSGDHLVVSNIGSSGKDGVSIDLGPDSQGLEVEWLPLPPEALRVDVSARGTLNGVRDQSLGSTGMEFQVDSFFDVFYDFAPLNSPTARLEFYLEGQHVRTETGARGPVVVRAPTLATECSKGGSRVPHPLPLPWPWPPFPFPFPPGPWWPIPCFIWEWELPQTLELPSGEALTADEVRILTENPDLRLDSVQNMSTRFQVDSFFDIFVDLGECRYRAPHRGLGQAHLESSGGTLTVSNIGSSGEDGVSVDLESDEGEFGRSFEWLPLPPLPPGSFLETQAFGTQSGVEEQFLGSLRLSSLGTQHEMTADYSPLGASQLQLQFFLNGELVGIRSNVPAQLPILVDSQEPPKGCGKVYPTPTLLCFFWIWGVPVPIIVPGGKTPITADQVLVLAQDATTPFDEIDRLTVRGAGVPDLRITSEPNALLPPEEGFWDQALALGQADVRRETSAQGGGLTISNIGSSGLDGVRFVLPPQTDTFAHFFAPLGQFSDYPEGTMKFDAIGRLQGDPGPRPLGSVNLRTNMTDGGIEIFTRYQDIGASSVRFMAYDNGALVADLSLPDGPPILRIPRWPDGCGKEPVPLPFPWPLCIWIDPGEDIPIEILGLGGKQTVIADTFRLLAENPDGALEELTEWGLEVGNIPFVIVGAAGQGIHVTAAPEETPGRTALHEAVPNPFNPRTKIAFDLSRQGKVKLQVYDLSGRLVDTLYSGTLTAGRQSFTWDGTDSKGNSVASGVYAIRLDSPEGSYSEKVTLVK